jgi:type IV pilus assembly protein PilA
MQTLRRRLTKNEEGFTLIELMVVVLIIAILIAIAIPTFLGAQNRARDRGAQSDLRNALTAAKTIATDSAGLFEVDNVAIGVSDLLAAEGALSYVAMASANTDNVGFLVSNLADPATTNGVITFVKQSASGDFFGISATSQGAVEYCRGDVIGDCDAPGDTGYTPDPW